MQKLHAPPPIFEPLMLKEKRTPTVEQMDVEGETLHSGPVQTGVGLAMLDAGFCRGDSKEDIGLPEQAWRTQTLTGCP